MNTNEIIDNLEVMRAEVEWEYPIDYAATIDGAIELIKENDVVNYGSVFVIGLTEYQLIKLEESTTINSDWMMANKTVKLDREIDAVIVHTVVNLPASILGSTVEVFATRERAEQTIERIKESKVDFSTDDIFESIEWKEKGCPHSKENLKVFEIELSMRRTDND